MAIVWSDEKRRLGDLLAWPRNPRQIDRKQAARLVESFDEFGQVETLAVGPANELYNGHQRLNVLMRERGPDCEVDVRVASRALTEKEREKLTIYLHKGAAGTWDFDILANAFEQDDLLAWGFEPFELGLDEDEPNAGADTEPQIDRAEELREKWQTATGQLWQLGEHRLICGDCTDAATVARVMGGEKAALVVTDPPYGMNLDASYKNSVDNSAKGIRASRGYAPVIGDDKDYDPRPLLEMFSEVSELFMWGGDYYADKLPRGGSWLVWDKRATIEELEYSSSEFELCWSKTPHHRTILRVPWFGLIGTEQQDTQKRLHPTQKPLGAIVPLVEYCSVGAIVYDPFLGSGTTLIACENLRRKCRAVEISPAYVAVALERWAQHTGKTPVLVEQN